MKMQDILLQNLFITTGWKEIYLPKLIESGLLLLEGFRLTLPNKKTEVFILIPKASKSITMLRLARAAIFCALYVVLSYTFMPLVYGPIQVRPAEGLTLLPLIYPEAIVGLWLGCMLSNIASPTGGWDVLMGGICTLVASCLTYLCGKIKYRPLAITLGGFSPILINAFALPLLWYLLSIEVVYWVNFASILISQTVFVYAVGIPLILVISKLRSKGAKGF